MNAFFDSLRADLLGRRLRPLLALLGLALAGAIAYALIAGGGSSTPAATSAPATSASNGVVVSAIKTEDAQAVAETTHGAGEQTGNATRTRNPFAPLPSPSAKKAASSSSASSGSSSSSAGTGSSSSSSSSTGTAESGSGSSGGAGSESGSSSGGSSPSKPKAKQKSSKPKATYRVDVLFGAAAPATPYQSAQLNLFANLELQQPLPSAKQALIVYRGAIAGANSVAFTLVGEVILRGVGTCRPSTSQCQVLDLQVGQTEELEYAPPGATATNYLLHVVSIETVKGATTPAAGGSLGGESKLGAALLRRAGLEALPGLRFSSAKGVLVFAGQRAFAARAHAAGRWRAGVSK